MLKQISAPRFLITFCAVFWLGLVIFASPRITLAQGAENYEAERQRAFQLYKEGRYNDALPVFEKLAAAKPSDQNVIEVLGFLVFGEGVHLNDAAARRQARLRARTLLLRAQEMGADDPLLKSPLDAVPPDGGDDTVFSKRNEVDDAMREGETAFARGDYSKAIAAYERALRPAAIRGGAVYGRRVL